MSLFSLSLKNVRHSLRDYAVFFFTLVIGVTLFYVFNAVGTQTQGLGLTADRGRIVELLQGALTGVSLFVSMVLGLLVVYASRFLMRRRNREFGLYLLLGMGKREISLMLLAESAFLGIGALVLGLLLGVVLSQAMGRFVTNLLLPGSAFRFSFSRSAAVKTIVFFVVIYVLVMLLNARAVGRMRLIDLIQSEKRSEQVRLKNPVLCAIVFAVGCVLLGFAYYMVGWSGLGISGAALTAYICIGALATLLVMWALSGMFLRIAMSLERTYYRGLNCYTFRQVSSKINTIVFSMTVICLMLFFAVCALSTALSLQGGMRAITEYCPADFELKSREILPQDESAPAYNDVVECYARYGYDLPAHFAQYVHFRGYHDSSTGADGLGGLTGGLQHVDGVAYAIRLSDYNALMALYGREGMDLADDEVALLCYYADNKRAYDCAIDATTLITMFGHTLRSAHPNAIDGFVDLSSGHTNTGIFVVPDAVVAEAPASMDYFVGAYRTDDGMDVQNVEAQCRAEHEAVDAQMNADTPEDGQQVSFTLQLATKIEMADSAIGMGALLAVVGLYLGLVFLVASGAILALRGLSDSVDSVQRYKTLRQLGADEDDISRSLLIQTGIFFLLPLVLACVHAVFGMRFISTYTSLVGTGGVVLPVVVTVAALLLVYGGYFMLTYVGSLRIIQGQAAQS